MIGVLHHSSSTVCVTHLVRQLPPDLLAARLSVHDVLAPEVFIVFELHEAAKAAADYRPKRVNYTAVSYCYRLRGG